MVVNTLCESGASRRAQMFDTKFPHGVIGLHRVEKAAVAAYALRTDNPEPIADLLGMGRPEVEWVLGCLEDADWNIADAIDLDANNQSINHTLNRETYSILRMKGVEA